MAEATAAPAPKATVTETKSAPAEQASDEAKTIWEKDLSTPEKAIAHDREVLAKEAEKLDHTDGPADNLSGDNSDSFEDHVHSNDPFKKAFPPGPDDPSKI